jgi:DNA-binding MarR family transcriptional regulator
MGEGPFAARQRIGPVPARAWRLTCCTSEPSTANTMGTFGTQSRVWSWKKRVTFDVPPALFETTGFLLAMAGAESRRRWVEWLAEWDLRPSHYSALMVLGERGAVSQQELGGMIGVDPRNLVPVIDVLERQRLVERRPHASDRRRNALDLTQAGRSLLKMLSASGRTLENEMLSGLDANEQATLQKLLLKLVRD